MEELWQNIVNFFTGNVWQIILFFCVFLFGWIVVKIVVRILKKVFSRTKMEQIAQNFLIAIIKFALYIVWILALLSIIGIEISGIITAMSAIILAIGLALEDCISNVANGIIIVSSKIFKKGDFVEVNGVSGSVEQINFLFTTIVTTDNKRITLPNSTVVNNAISNYGANKTRRIDFTFSVAYETDVEAVKKIVTDVMKSDGRVLLDPAPFCRLKTLGSSSIDFFANCWCDTGDYWDVYYYIIENVYNEFKRNGISIPYNQIEVRSRTDAVNMPIIERPLPKRVEKVRNEEKHHFDIENDDIVKILKTRKKTKNEDLAESSSTENTKLTKAEKAQARKEAKEAKKAAKKSKKKN